MQKWQRLLEKFRERTEKQAHLRALTAAEHTHSHLLIPCLFLTRFLIHGYFSTSILSPFNVQSEGTVIWIRLWRRGSSKEKDVGAKMSLLFNFENDLPYRGPPTWTRSFCPSLSERPVSVCPDIGSGTRPATGTCYRQVCSWSEAHLGTHRGARTHLLPHGGLEHGAGLTCWGPGVWRRPPRPGSLACDRRAAAPPGRRWSPCPPARGTRPRWGTCPPAWPRPATASSSWNTRHLVAGVLVIADCSAQSLRLIKTRFLERSSDTWLPW